MYIKIIVSFSQQYSSDDKNSHPFTNPLSRIQTDRVIILLYFYFLYHCIRTHCCAHRNGSEGHDGARMNEFGTSMTEDIYFFSTPLFPFFLYYCSCTELTFCRRKRRKKRSSNREN